ncbi:MAG: endonuclease Q family protein [candidate division NC10 bacterium]|nr:endonuclease Q family protein [candidate division NC10 bacterium]
MMDPYRFIADLHVHSKYSRATSRDMQPEALAKWAEIKGIKVLGTGDFTHPTYFAELKAKLEPQSNGLLSLAGGGSRTYFLLTAEVSNIFSERGRLRKIHTLLMAPGFEVAERINDRLGKMGRLSADGRPTFGFPVRELVKMVLDLSADCLVVPAHAWTPWFSLFGANSGFDSLEECFGAEAKHIYAIETGLSSDPEMNWRLSTLDSVALISNSDAHSPNRIGREANVFAGEPSYEGIVEAIRKKDRGKFLFTLEFYPEEGKYHYDGHRACGVVFSPQETKRNDSLCPVCKKRLTVGVLHRVESLADRPAGIMPPGAIPSVHLVPLEEIIASALEQGVDTAAVEREYQRMISHGGSEFEILLDLSPVDLASFCSPKILEGILRVREGRLRILPGHDGVYGQIDIFWDEGEAEEAEGAAVGPSNGRQMTLFA